MDAATALASLHLRPGQSLLAGIQEALAALVYQSPTHSFVVQVWVLYAIHLLVLVFSVVGILARYRRGNGWIFVCDVAGATQGLYAIYAVFFCIAAPLYPLKRAPTDSAFAWELVTFIPLGLAFHTVTWSTALAPTTAAFLSNSRPGRSLAKGRIASGFAIGSLVLFIASLVPSFYTTAHYRGIVFTEVELALAQIDAALLDGADQTQAILTLAESWQPLAADAARLVKSHRQLIITYFSWAVFWICIYLPTAVRLLMTLVQRRQRLQRSLKSLKVLGELVTNDDLEAAAVAATQLPVLERSVSRAEAGHRPARPYSSHPAGHEMDNKRGSPALVPIPDARFDPDSDLPTKTKPEAIELLSLSSPPYASSDSTTSLSSHGKSEGGSYPLPELLPPRKLKSNGRPSTSGSQKIAAAKQFAEKLMDDFGLSNSSQGGRREQGAETDRTASRGAEVRVALRKTSKLIATIGVQLFLVLIMASSYFAFCLLVLSDRASPIEINTLFITWTGWTFAVPAFVGSLLFAILSVRDTPTAVSPTSPSLAPSPLIDPDYSPSAAIPTPLPTPTKRGRGRHYASARRPDTGDSAISASDALSAASGGARSFASEVRSLREMSQRERAESRATALSFETGSVAFHDSEPPFDSSQVSVQRSITNKWVPSAWALDRQRERTLAEGGAAPRE